MTTLRLFNYSQRSFSGWRRVVVDAVPKWRAGRLNAGTLWVPTNTPGVVDVRPSALGADAWEFDFPGEELPNYDDHPLLHWPDNILEYFGGWPTVTAAGGSQTPLQLVTFRLDGAGFYTHLRARIAGTRMMVVDLWFVWYPEQPWLRAEAMVTCSNPTVGDMTETLTAPLMLTFGDALVLPLGGQGGQGQLVAASTMFGDGQARVIPLVIGWLRHMHGMQADAFIAEAEFAVGGHGVEQLLLDGNPIMAPGFNALAWAGAMRPDSVRRIHTWDVGTTGPNKKQGDTGAQTGDQVFVGGEMMVEPKTELVRYLGALKTANYPQHHREADGSPFDPARHQSRPNIFWHGRPHEGLWSIVERLGKPRPLDFEGGESNGWLGMDPEHWLMNTLTAVCRLLWSPACQHLLEVQARIYPLQWTTQPGWSTSQAYASRAIGYEFMNAVNMQRVLHDPLLADLVAAHSARRWSLVTRPAMALTAPWVPDGFWPTKISLWQQALCAYGLQLWGRFAGVSSARDAAFTAAMQVLDKGFHRDAATGKWHTYSTNLLPSGDPDPAASAIYDLFGNPCAPAVVLTQAIEHSLAPGVVQEIRAQEVADATQWYQAQWLPPLIAGEVLP